LRRVYKEEAIPSPKSAGRERGVYWEKPKSHIR